MKVSQQLAAILAELPADHPSAKRFKSTLGLVKDLEIRCEELAEDSRKMAKQLTDLRAELGMAEDRIAHRKSP